MVSPIFDLLSSYGLTIQPAHGTLEPRADVRVPGLLTESTIYIELQSIPRVEYSPFQVTRSWSLRLRVAGDRR